MLDNLLFCFNAAMPVFALVLIGCLLKKLNIIDDTFSQKATKLVFNVALPVMLFTKVAKSDFIADINPKLILVGVFGTVFIFLILKLVFPRIFKKNAVSSAAIQGAFRSNFAILGIPLISNLFGEAGDLMCASLMAFIAPLYSTLSVIALLPASRHAGRSDAKKLEDAESFISGSFKPARLFKELFTNPLIIGTFLGIPFSLFKIPIFTAPEFSVLATTLDYLYALTSPLALICVGASFSFKSSKNTFAPAMLATFVKLIISPVIILTAAYLCGLRGTAFGVLFIMSAAPTSVSSYIMARNMDADHLLSTQIILFTTFFSIITVTVGASILKSVGLI